MAKYKAALGLVVLVAVAAFARSRYDRRPPFAGGFYVVGHGFVMDWERDVSLSISQGRQVFIDRHDNVLLLVGIDSEGNTEWVPDSRLGGQLVLRRLSNGSTRKIEWRRDCFIIVRGDDPVKYIILPVSEFRDAIRNSRPYENRIEKLIDAISPPSETPSAIGAATRPD